MLRKKRPIKTTLQLTFNPPHLFPLIPHGRLRLTLTPIDNPSTAHSLVLFAKSPIDRSYICPVVVDVLEKEAIWIRLWDSEGEIVGDTEGGVPISEILGSKEEPFEIRVGTGTGVMGSPGRKSRLRSGSSTRRGKRGRGTGSSGSSSGGSKGSGIGDVVGNGDVEDVEDVALYRLVPTEHLADSRVLVVRVWVVGAHRTTKRADLALVAQARNLHLVRAPSPEEHEEEGEGTSEFRSRRRRLARHSRQLSSSAGPPRRSFFAGLASLFSFRSASSTAPSGANDRRRTAGNVVTGDVGTGSAVRRLLHGAGRGPTVGTAGASATATGCDAQQEDQEENLEVLFDFPIGRHARFTGTVKKLYPEGADRTSKNYERVPHCGSGLMVYKHVAYEGGFVDGFRCDKNAKLRDESTGAEIRVGFRYHRPYGRMREKDVEGNIYLGAFQYRTPAALSDDTGRNIRLDQFVRHGQGVLYSPSQGTLFCGAFRDGVPDGRGIIEFLSTGERYVGSWRKGSMHGKGAYSHIDGSFFYGQFVAGQRSGRGRLFMSNGFQMEGNWDRHRHQLNQVTVGPSEDVDVYDENLLDILKTCVKGRLQTVEDNPDSSRSVLKHYLLWTALFDEERFSRELLKFVEAALRQGARVVDVDAADEDDDTDKRIPRPFTDSFFRFVCRKSRQLREAVDHFCGFVEYVYGEGDQTSSIRLGLRETARAKDRLVYVRTDIASFLEAMNACMDFVLRQKEFGVHVEDRLVTKFCARFRNVLLEEVQSRLYSILMHFYRNKYEERNNNFRQKIKSIRLALRSLATRSRFKIYGELLRQLTSGADLCGLDINLMTGFIALIDILRSEEEIVAAHLVESTSSMLGVLVEKFDAVLEQTENEPLKEGLLLLMEERRGQLVISPGDSKEAVNELRNVLKMTRLSVDSLQHLSIVGLVEKCLLSNFKEGSYGSLLDQLPVLQSGFECIRQLDFQGMACLDIDYCVYTLGSLEESLTSLFKKNFEQFAYVNRSINERVKALCAGINILAARCPQYVALFDEVRALFQSLNLGSRVMKIQKTSELNMKLQHISRQLESEDPCVCEFVDSIYFSFTTIMDLYHMQKSIIPFSLQKKNLTLVLDSLCKAISYFDQSGLYARNHYLFVYWVRLVNFVKSELAKAESEAQDYDVVLAMKGKLLKLRFQLENLRDVQFSRFNFPFDVLNILRSDMQSFFSDFRAWNLDREFEKIIEAMELQKSFESDLVVASEMDDLRICLKLLNKQDRFSFFNISPHISCLEFCLKSILMTLEMSEFSEQMEQCVFIRKEFIEGLSRMQSQLRVKRNRTLELAVDHGLEAFICKRTKFDFHFEKTYLCLRALGISEKFIPSFSLEFPFPRSLGKLNELPGRHTIHSKRRCLSEFEFVLREEMSEIAGIDPPYEEDDKLPIILYIFMIAELDHVIEFAFLKDWADEFSSMRIRYETFLNYVKSLDPYAQHANQLLTVVGNIISPLKNYLLKKIQFLKSVHQPITLKWLVHLLGYVYCHVGFLDKDEDSLELIECDLLVEYLRDKYMHLNPIMLNVGFYLRYGSEERKFEIVFEKKFAPEIYNQVLNQVLTDFKEYVHVKCS